MTKAGTYTAVYERDPESDAWLVHIKGITGCQTYGRSLRQAEDRIREVLGLWLDRDPDGLVIASQWPPDLENVAVEATQARSDATKAAQRAAKTLAQSAKRLDRMGLSRRDAADVLGISHQRVQQLLAS